MTTEYLRYALIFVGLLVLGFNAAVIAHANEIVRAVRAWRIFIVGKSGLTVFVIVSLYENIDRPLGWLVPIAAAAMLLTLASLAMLENAYRHRRQNGR